MKKNSEFKAQSAISRGEGNIAQVPEDLYESHRKSGGVRARVIAVVAVLAVLLVLGCAYALGVDRYQDRFVPGTTVNGMSVSDMTADELAAILDEEAASYTDTVTVGDTTFTVSGADIAYDVDAEGAVAAAMGQQDSYLWPILLVTQPEITVDAGVTYDEATLQTIISREASSYTSEHVLTGTVSASYDDASEQYVLTGEAEGSAMQSDVVLAAVEESLAACEEETDASSALRDATPEDTTVGRAVTIANRDRSANIALLVLGEEATHVNYEIVNFVWIENDELVVDEEAIASWVAVMLGDYLNTSDGENDYDLDQESLTTILAANLRQGNTSSIECPMTPEQRPEGLSHEAYDAANEWDSSIGRYVDVDLTSQYARFYDTDGSTLWESAIVSGSYGHSTPTGTNYVNALMTNQTLVGLDEDEDGEADYESFVNYWMPFIGNLYAFHDATWRTYFGGTYYAYNGSHGCINLPLDNAAALYELLEVGDTVVIHY